MAQKLGPILPFRMPVSVTRFLKYFVCFNLFMIICNINISSILVELLNFTIINHFHELSKTFLSFCLLPGVKG